MSEMWNSVAGAWEANADFVDGHLAGATAAMLDAAGVDVGSKAEIHGIVRDLAGRGLGVVVISDDLPELLGACHRVLVMREGRITDDLPGGTVTEAELAHRLAS